MVALASLTSIRGREAETKDADKTGVVIADLSFSPKTLTVPAGATVIWTNHDNVPHAVASGMADRVETLDGAVARLLKPQGRGALTKRGGAVAEDAVTVVTCFRDPRGARCFPMLTVLINPNCLIPVVATT